MLRVYVAGAIRNPDVTESLKNMARGITQCVMLINQGYAPFCPFLDLQYFLHPFGHEISVEKIQAVSMKWLEVSDALLVLPGSEASKGTQMEILRAKELNIPVCYNEGELEWLNQSLQKQKV